MLPPDDFDALEDDPGYEETPEERAEREADERRWRGTARWNSARADAHDRLVHQYLWSDAGASRFMDVYDKQIKDRSVKEGVAVPSFDDYWQGFWEKAEQTHWGR